MIDYTTDVIIYLTQKQAEQGNAMLIDFAEQNGKVKRIDKIPNCIFEKNGEWQYITPSYTVGELMPRLVAGNSEGGADINIKDYPQTHQKYGQEGFPKENNWIYKIKHWAETEDSRYVEPGQSNKGLGIITDKQAQTIIDAIMKSSGSWKENPWAYSIRGEDKNHRQDGENSVSIDIHDRRIDDVNSPLIIAGGALMGVSDNPSIRSKMTVLGEAEVQDSTAFGRLLDFYGENGYAYNSEGDEEATYTPFAWGHLVPNENYPKVYLNRGQTRYNHEEWVDSYSELNDDVGKDIEIVFNIGVSEIRDGYSYREYYAYDIASNKYCLYLETILQSSGETTTTLIRTFDPNSTFVENNTLYEQYDRYYEYDDSNWELKTTLDEDYAIIDITDENSFPVGANIQSNAYYRIRQNLEMGKLYEKGANHGLGFGTVEANKEIVSHTTITADHGLIIEDGIGDSTDKATQRYVFKRKGKKLSEAEVFLANGTEQHPTDNFALTIKHDGAKIKGHTIIEDEVDKNVFKKVNGVIYYPNPSTDENDVYETDNIIKNCWVCSEADLDNTKPNRHTHDGQYGHWCTNSDGQATYVVDMWPGFLYHEVDKQIDLFEVETIPEKIYDQEGQERTIYPYHYYIYVTEEERNGEIVRVQYLLKKKNGYYTRTEILNSQQYEDMIYVNNQQAGDDDNIYYTSQNEQIDSKYIHFIPGIQIDGENRVGRFILEGEGENEKVIGFVATMAERIVPELHKVYQIKNDFETYTQPDFYKPCGYEPVVPQTCFEPNTAINANDYLYWDGTYFRTIGNDYPSFYTNHTSEGYGSLTVGTRQDSGIGKHSLEVGTDNQAAHANSFVVGTHNITSTDNQVLIGKYAANETNAFDSSEDNAFAIGEGTQNNNSNVFEVTEAGNTHIAGNTLINGALTVDETSDLKKKVTIGDSITSGHDLALEVKNHAKFSGQVEINEHNNSVEDTLHNKGTALFDKTVTIGRSDETYYIYDETQSNWITETQLNLLYPIIDITSAEELPTSNDIRTNTYYRVSNGTFWHNLDSDKQRSTFVGLKVHGEIENERIPQNLYTSMLVNGNRVYNEFADKFFVNSSVASSTATFRGSFTPEDYNPHRCEKIEVVTISAIPSAVPASADINKIHEYNDDSTHYYMYINNSWQEITPIECEKNLPINYTNQIVWDDTNPTVFLLKRNWTSEYSGYAPYEDVITTIQGVGSGIEAGLYRFWYDNNSDPTVPPINTASVNDKINWLNNYIRNKYINEIIPQDHKVNAKKDLANILVPDNKSYYVISIDTFYQYNNGTWTECNPVADNNDYCYFQIWDKKQVVNAPTSENVLFAAQYNSGGTQINSWGIDTVHDPEPEMEIICEKYKYTEIIHPLTGSVEAAKWLFEYQLNNSGYTQKQWDAINSGVTGGWKNGVDQDLSSIIESFNAFINGWNNKGYKNKNGDTYKFLDNTFVDANNNTNKTQFFKGSVYIIDSKSILFGDGQSVGSIGNQITFTPDFSTIGENPAIKTITIPFESGTLATQEYAKDNFVTTYPIEDNQSNEVAQQINGAKTFLKEVEFNNDVTFSDYVDFNKEISCYDRVNITGLCKLQGGFFSNDYSTFNSTANFKGITYFSSDAIVRFQGLDTVFEEKPTFNRGFETFGIGLFRDGAEFGSPVLLPTSITFRALSRRTELQMNSNAQQNTIIMPSESGTLALKEDLTTAATLYVKIQLYRVDEDFEETLLQTINTEWNATKVGPCYYFCDEQLYNDTDPTIDQQTQPYYGYTTYVEFFYSAEARTAGQGRGRGVMVSDIRHYLRPLDSHWQIQNLQNYKISIDYLREGQTGFGRPVITISGCYIDNIQ